MIRRMVLALLLSGALLSGCGGSSSTSSGKSSSTATTTTSTSSSTGSSQQYEITACKSVLRLASTLSPKVKSKIEAICEKAAHGDAEAVRTAAKEVCAEVINASTILTASEKKKAIASCKAGA
jgi:hypothetical protein